MLSPKWNKILLPVVLVIWLGVVFRFMGGCGESNQTVASNQINYALIPMDSLEAKEVYELQLGYRDPFLDKAPAPKAPKGLQRERSASLTVVPNPNPVTKRPLPPIAYKGGVQSQAGEGMTGILFYQNRPFTIRKGDSLAGMKIVQLDMHSIQIAYSDSLYTLISE